MTGRDKTCANYVFNEDKDMKLVTALASLIMEIRMAASSEKKPCLVIAIGCTGGQHRSVAVVEAVAEELRHMKNLIQNCHIETHHRDELFWSLEEKPEAV